MALNGQLGVGFLLTANVDKAMIELTKLARGLIAIQDHARRAGQALDFKVASGFSQAARAAKDLSGIADRVNKDLRLAYSKTGVMSPLMAPDKTAIHSTMGASMALIREHHKEAKRNLDEQNEKLQKQKQAWKDIGGTLSGLITKATKYTFALGLGGAAGIARAAGGKVGFKIPEISGKYESELAAIRAVAGGTPEEFKAIKDEISHIANITRYTPVQIAEAFRHIRVSGKDTTESIKLLGSAATIAQASFNKLTAPRAGELIAAMTKQFGLSADEADRFAAAMVRTQQVSALHIHEMQRVFRQFGVVSMFDKRKGGPGGFEAMTDMLAIAGALRSTGLPPEMAGRYAKSAAVNLMAGKLAKVEKLFAMEGKAPVVGPDRELRRPLDVVADFMDILAKKPTGDRAKIARDIIGKDVLAFTNLATFQKQINGVSYQGAEAIRALATQYRNLNGVTKEFNETLLNTWEGTKLLLEGPISDLAERLKLPMQEHMRKSLRPVVSMLNQFLDVVKKNEGELKHFSAALVGGVGFLHFINVMHEARHILWSIVKLPLQFVAAVLTLAVAIPVVFAFGVALYGIYVIMQTVGDRITGGFSNIGKKVSLFWKGLMELISIGGFSKEVDKEMSKAENQGVRKWVKGVGMALHRVRAFFEGFALGLDLDKIAGAFGRLGEAFLKLLRTIATLMGISETSDFMKMMTPDFWKKGQEAGKGFTNALASGLEWLTKKIEYFSTAQGKADLIGYWTTFKNVVYGFGLVVLYSALAVLYFVRGLTWLTENVGGVNNALWVLIIAFGALVAIKIGTFFVTLATAFGVGGAAALVFMGKILLVIGTLYIAYKAVQQLIEAYKAWDELQVTRQARADIQRQGYTEAEKQGLKDGSLVFLNGKIVPRTALPNAGAGGVFPGQSPDLKYGGAADIRTHVSGKGGDLPSGVLPGRFSPEEQEKYFAALKEGARQGVREGMAASKIQVEGPNTGWGKPHVSGAAAK
jgi:TP901 family phage tail tape measure protein